MSQGFPYGGGGDPPQKILKKFVPPLVPPRVQGKLRGGIAPIKKIVPPPERGGQFFQVGGIQVSSIML